MTKQHADHIFFLSHPRTASHLFERILSEQSSASPVLHPFMNARNDPDSGSLKFDAQMAAGHIDDTHKQKLKALAQGAFDSILANLDQAKAKRQRVFLHEHTAWLLDPAITLSYFASYSNLGKLVDTFDPPFSPQWTLRFANQPHPGPRTNITMLPDAFYLQPNRRVVTLLRHPAKCLPSVWRFMRDLLGSTASDPAVPWFLSGLWSFHRQLLEWLFAHADSARAPIVMDSDDILAPQSPVLARLCSELGLAESELLLKWSAATDEETSGMPWGAKRAMQTLLASEGVRSDMAVGSVNVNEEEELWAEEFGEDEAKFLRRQVDGSMSDYYWLYERRLRA